MSDNDATFGGPMFSREMLDNVPRHDHDCGLPHVDERCPREVMVKLLRPNAGDDLFLKYSNSAAYSQALAGYFRLPKVLLQSPGDMNYATAIASVEFYHASILGKCASDYQRRDPRAELYGNTNGLETMIASEVSARANIAARASSAANNTIILDADYESLLESGGDCRVTIVHPDAFVALAGAMGDTARSVGTGPQCTEHDLFTDDDGVQRCVFCMATKDEIEAEDALLQAQAYESVYGACEHCGAFDDDDHDGNCPHRPCTEEEDAAHEQCCDDPGRHDDCDE